MANKYGIVISQAGIPIDRAADYQKVLDSDWKFLNINVEMNVDFSTPALSGANGYRKYVVFEHNLGYKPAFEFTPSTLSGGNPDVFFNGYKDVMTSIAVDDKALYVVFLYTGGSTNPIRVKGTLRIFALDVMTEYTAPSSPAGPLQPLALAMYGAKFSDPNRGSAKITDEGVYAFSLNTQAKQISLHKHGTATAASGTLTIVHNVGYPPTYMVARVKDDSTWGAFYGNPFGAGVETIGPMMSVAIRANTTNDDIVFRGQQSSIVGKFAYIILKDPAEVAA